MKISACLIVKNEEKNIKLSLESIKGFVDEIVVVDTGSVDKSREIAKSLPAKVYDFVWNNDFAAARNFAIEKAAGEWIVFLDADEFFAHDSSLRVKGFLLQAQAKGLDAVMCQVINIDQDDNNRVRDIFKAIRFFRKSRSICYRNVIHEELSRLDGKNMQVGMLPDDIKIYHTGYSGNIVQKKLQRNLEIMLEDIKKNGGEERYYRYLCDCYHGLKQYDLAVKYAKLHIASKQTSLYSESTVYIKMLYSLIQNKATPTQMKYEFEQAIEKFSDLPDFYAQYANYLFDQKNYTKATLFYQQAIQLYKKDVSNVASTFTGKISAVYYNLGRLYLLQNQNELALTCFCDALLLNRFFRSAFQAFYQLIVLYPEVQIIDILNSIYKKEKKDLSFLVQNLKLVKLNKVYIYYANALKNKFGIEDENLLQNEFLSLHEHDKLYCHNFDRIAKMYLGHTEVGRQSEENDISIEKCENPIDGK